MESLAKTAVLVIFSLMMLVVLPGLEARRLEVEESTKALHPYSPIIASCAPKLPKNCGDEVKESVLGLEGSVPTADYCRQLVRWGKTCHDAFAQLLVSREPASQKSSILTNSKTIWEGCVDVEESSPIISSCAAKLSKNCVDEVKQSVLGLQGSVPTDKCCSQLVQSGKTCHDAFAQLLVSREPASQKSSILTNSKTIWEGCVDVEESSPFISSCAAKLTKSCGDEMKQSVLGLQGSVPTDKCCRQLVQSGKTCHDAFAQLLVSREPASQKSSILENSKTIWEECVE
ncbi:hypothetical protein Tsubulata_020776, partial [Turnera subulata]